jgi:hypothetical protein
MIRAAPSSGDHREGWVEEPEFGLVFFGGACCCSRNRNLITEWWACMCPEAPQRYPGVGIFYLDLVVRWLILDSVAPKTGYYRERLSASNKRDND